MILLILLLLFNIFGFLEEGDKLFTDLIDILGLKYMNLFLLLIKFKFLSLFLTFFFSLKSIFVSLLLLYLFLLILFFEVDKGNIVLYLLEFLVVLLNILLIKKREELTFPALLLFKLGFIFVPFFVSSFFGTL